MRRNLIALALLAGVVTTSGQVLASPAVDEVETAPRGDLTLSYERMKFESDAHVLAIALYWEGGSTGESVEGMRRIADVIKMRAAANRRDFGGGDLYGVVFHSHKTKTGRVCQFSFACLPSTKRAPIPGAYWDTAKQVAREALQSPPPPEHDVAEYYLNPTLSSLRSICWFKSTLVEVGQVGRHIFWREPKEWDEPRRAAASKPEECVRYEAMLEAAKQKPAAKKRKASKRHLARVKMKRGKLRFASASRR